MSWVNYPHDQRIREHGRCNCACHVIGRTQPCDCGVPSWFQQPRKATKSVKPRKVNLESRVKAFGASRRGKRGGSINAITVSKAHNFHEPRYLGG